MSIKFRFRNPEFIVGFLKPLFCSTTGASADLILYVLPHLLSLQDDSSPLLGNVEPDGDCFLGVRNPFENHIPY